MNESAEKLVKLLSEKGRIVATAASCTGGLIAKLITDIPGSSDVFHYGAVTYSNEIKAEMLGVDERTLAENGAVSEQTAVQMAEGVRKKANADYGVSSTGISGPGGDGVCNEAGLSFIAVSDGEHIACTKLETHRNDRDFNRTYTAVSAIKMLIDFMEQKQ